jgi:K+-sensing histidine kinase KdpD
MEMSQDAKSVLSLGGDGIPSPASGPAVEGARVFGGAERARGAELDRGGPVRADPDRDGPDREGPDRGESLATLRAFLEELRRSFSHDLRTPLGTIVNYAALLEGADGVALSDQHNFARHIRRNAMRAANMLEHLSSAAVLASRPAAPEPVDVEELLERALLASGGKDKVRVASDGGVPPLDPALLQFVWKSYVSIEADVRGQAPREVELAVAHGGDGRVTLIVSVGADASKGAAVDLARFLAEAGESARPESRHALRLAADVLELHGGSIALHGRAGAGSSLAVTLPPHR